jgi:triosephosphate isomerase
MKRFLVVGNWKMNGLSATNADLLGALLRPSPTRDRVDIAVCVPAPYLAQAQLICQGSDLVWGAQDVSAHESGAYTGEVSAAMLHDFKARYVLVGHSERRQYHGESSSVVAAKAQRALAKGITPIVCVGETLQERGCGQASIGGGDPASGPLR